MSRDAESLWANEEMSFLSAEAKNLIRPIGNRSYGNFFYQTSSIQKITIDNQRLESKEFCRILLKEEQFYAAKKKENWIR
ncbi:MAG: hypothetical protein R2764_16755 [Bacteroidales bacterium]